ncbi:MAG TPA: hypothetical protein VNS88_03265, partial [Nitrospiraceae bacterium]|nr:hypothetical protein [Nitrospiraceae bacterium]
MAKMNMAKMNWILGADGCVRPYTWSGCGLMLIRWNEDFGYESFVIRGRGVLLCARFEGVHFPGVEGARHLYDQARKLLG